MNTFTCYMCKGVFEKGWTDEEAKEEREEVFGSVAIEECEVVCDDCYKSLGLGDG